METSSTVTPLCAECLATQTSNSQAKNSRSCRVMTACQSAGLSMNSEMVCANRPRKKAHIGERIGSQFWGRLALSVSAAESDEPALLVAILEDVTEYKRIAEKSREAEKME